MAGGWAANCCGPHRRLVSGASVSEAGACCEIRREPKKRKPQRTRRYTKEGSKTHECVPLDGRGRPSSISLGCGSMLWNWVDRQLQSFYLAHYDRLSRWEIGGGDGVPKFAVDKDFSLRR
jgi:hypothetical protein